MINSFYNSLPSFPSHLTYAGKTAIQEMSFEQAISSGCSEIVQNTSLRDLNSPLPNGELPLHFAVREGQIEIVKILLEKGADPTTKDFQALTAIDHAFLQRNLDALTLLLGTSFDSTLLKKVTAQSTKQAPDAFQEIANSVQLVNLQKETLFPIQQAVIDADCNAVSALLKTEDLKNIKTDPGKHSLLHLAAMSSSLEMFKLLLHAGLSPNARDLLGNTPAHYAALNPNSAFLTKLIQDQANPLEANNKGVFPLSLLAYSTKQRDPLNVSLTHSLMFTATVLLTLRNILISSGALNPHRLSTVKALSNLGSELSLLLYAAEGLHHLFYIQKSWPKILSFLSLSAFENLPVIRPALSTWKLYFLGQSTFAGLKCSYKNIRYRTLASLYSATAHSVNMAAKSANLWSSLQKDYNYFSNPKSTLSNYVKDTTSPEYSRDKTYDKLLSARNETSFYQTHFKNRPDKDRIQDAKLNLIDTNLPNPNTEGWIHFPPLFSQEKFRLRLAEKDDVAKEDAIDKINTLRSLTLLNPFFTIETSLEQIKQAHRNLSNQFHPDKNPGKDTTSIQAKINAASDFLKKKKS